jgi:hypothetical protein
LPVTLQVSCPSPSPEESPEMVFTSVLASEASLPESLLQVPNMSQQLLHSELDDSDLPRLDNTDFVVSSLDGPFDQDNYGETSDALFQHNAVTGETTWYT